MRFNLVDRVHAWEPGKRLTASKVLTLGEEYLADHFPTFPVMPGVLMLQAVVEAAAWLWRATTDYRHPVIVLRDVRNVKYGTFMQPGRRMDVGVELSKTDGDTATFCFAQPDKERPTKFETKEGSGLTLSTWKKVKK